MEINKKYEILEALLGRYFKDYETESGMYNSGFTKAIVKEDHILYITKRNSYKVNGMKIYESKYGTTKDLFFNSEYQISLTNTVKADYISSDYLNHFTLHEENMKFFKKI